MSDPEGELLLCPLFPLVAVTGSRIQPFREGMHPGLRLEDSGSRAA